KTGLLSFASVDSKGTDQRVTGTLGAALNLVTGGSANLSVSSTWHRPVSMSWVGVPSNTSPTYPDGFSVYDPYGWNQTLFWTSSASASVTMPLPFTKGFGWEGSPNYYNYQVSLSGERRAGWTQQTTRNAVLDEALQAWWDAAQAMQSLRTLLELRDVLEERGASQKRLFDNGLATRYDLAQLEVQQAALDTQEEAAWNALLAASSHLGTLVAHDQQLLLLPSDAEPLLRAPVKVEQAGLYDRVLTSHPAIKAQEEAYDASKLGLAFAENQDLPDLSFLASFSVGQTDVAYGYASLTDSLAHLVKPDNTNLFVGVHYHLPIGMNATGAALDRARLTERQSYDRTRQVRQQVVNSLDQSLGSVRSAQAVVRQSEEDLRLSQCAFDRARDQRDLGLVPEFEVLNKYQDLVSARLGLINARIGVRKAHAHLLAAQGTLEQDYVR
ncbi:MAG: TolC family protein, partial [Alphaproteobacteria bacterium]|nr:TolC family protein [Alphaproteobacteria bacterium]